MKHKVTFVDESNNQYHFRVDGHSVRLYADCYEKAVQKLKAIYGNDIEIKDV